MASPHFTNGLNAYLNDWLNQTARLDEADILRLNPDFNNLLHIVELGLALPETREKTSELIIQCFFWVEQLGYHQLWQPLTAVALKKIPAERETLRFRLLKQLGQWQRLQYQLDKAIATLQEAERLAKNLTNLEAVAEVHMNLCQVYHLMGEYKTAEQYGLMALESLPPDSLRLRSITLRTLGLLSQEQGMLNQAESYLQDSLKYAESPKEKSYSLNVLAVIYQHKEKNEWALNAYSEVLSLLNGAANINFLAEVRLNKGGLLYSMGQLDEAEAEFKTVEALLHQRPGLLFHKARIANNLGCVLRDKKMYPAAEICFRRSIQQFSQVGSGIFEANAWGNLAKTHSQQGRVQEAVHGFDRAIELMSSFPNNTFAQKSLDIYTRLRADLARPD